MIWKEGQESESGCFSLVKCTVESRYHWISLRETSRSSVNNFEGSLVTKEACLLCFILRNCREEHMRPFIKIPPCMRANIKVRKPRYT